MFIILKLSKCMSLHSDLVWFGLWCLKPLSTIYLGRETYVSSKGGCRGHDRMLVRFTTTCAISVYHH
jgi:hypothetical protein